MRSKFFFITSVRNAIAICISHIDHQTKFGKLIADILVHSSNYRDPQNDAITAVQFRLARKHVHN